MRRAPAAGMILLAGAAGCSGADTSPIDSGVPTAATSSSRLLPSPGQQWAGLRAKCPQLTRDTAERLNVAGAGAPTDEYATHAAGVDADCHWGATDTRGVAVDARISVSDRQEAADAQWRVLSSGQTERIDVGDEGFVAEEVGAVVVRARSGNAVVTVRLVAAADQPDVGPLRQAASEIARDVLDDLVTR